MNKITKALAILASDSSAAHKIGLSYSKSPTLNFEEAWDVIANVNGWRFQRNKFTKHARIIDPDDHRRAWGSFEAIEKMLTHLADTSDEDHNTECFERV